MIHLRVVTPPDLTLGVLDALSARASVLNIVHLPGVATRPDGDLVLCDVAREDGSAPHGATERIGVGGRARE
ncbi:MAG TPA: hypothetical protein VJ689_06130, partial [Gaiellaceae bacterium]|nr:hypothetical protein [Gaiellaceae bacterium]